LLDDGSSISLPYWAYVLGYNKNLKASLWFPAADTVEIERDLAKATWSFLDSNNPSDGGTIKGGRGPMSEVQSSWPTTLTGAFSPFLPLQSISNFQYDVGDEVLFQYTSNFLIDAVVLKVHSKGTARGVEYDLELKELACATINNLEKFQRKVKPVKVRPGLTTSFHTYKQKYSL
jgi:hypothetical protein